MNLIAFLMQNKIFMYNNNEKNEGSPKGGVLRSTCYFSYQEGE